MPQIKKIVAENFTSDTDHKTEEFSSLADGINAIKNLNGDNRSNVFLECDGEYLFINGGKDGRYLVNSANFNQKKFYNLINPKNSPEEQVEIATSGRTSGTYSLRRCINLDTVIQAVSYFYEKTMRDPDLTWEPATSDYQ